MTSPEQKHQLPFAAIGSAFPHLLFPVAMIFFSMYARILPSPLLVFIQRDLGIGPAAATRFFLPLAISYSVAMLLSGFVAERLQHSRTIALSGTFIGIGLITLGLAQGILGMNIAFAVIGIGAGFYPPSGVAAVTSLVSDEIRGKALSIHEIGPNSAYILAPLLVSAGIFFGSWRMVPILSGVAAIIVGISFDRFAVAGRFPGERPHLNNLKAVLRQPQFWAVTVFFSLAAGAAMGVYSILPTYLITVRGFEVGPVNTLISLSRISGLAMIFVAGFLIDRFGIKRHIAVVLSTTALLTIAIGLLSGKALLAVVFFQPVIISTFFPAATYAASQLGPPRVRNVGVSLMIPAVNVVASGIFPPVMGHLSETGNVDYGFIGLGLLMLASLVLLPMLGRFGGVSESGH
ncbi:MAG: MFS transporter [Spirochaetales bacterium]|nr:MFS transporter [Spirochaetales bacterium]MCF7939479.1 MFS transporter [Spirochaetales bacterium]